MTIKKSNARSTHLFKSKQESFAYNRFLSENIASEPIVEKTKSLEKTNSSTFEKDDNIEIPKIKPKSKKIIISDFIKNNLFAEIIIGVTLILISIFLGLWSDQKYYVNKVNDEQNSIDKISNNYDQLISKISGLDKDFSVFKTGINKDIEFIKIILKLK